MLIVLGVLAATLSATPPASPQKEPSPAVDAETRRLLLEGQHEALAQRLEARLKEDPAQRAAAGLLAALLVGVDDARARELQAKLGPARPDPIIPPVRPVTAGALAYVATSRLRLRAAPSASAAAVGWVAIGAPVRVERLSGEWARVRVGRRTLEVVKGQGTLLHPDRWSATLDTGRQGFLSLAYLDGAPPELEGLRASAAKAREAQDPDLAASVLLRAWALNPSDAALREALVDAALAAERFAVAVLATRPAPAPAPATFANGTKAEYEGFQEGSTVEPEGPYLVSKVDWVFGCQGSLPLASLTPRQVGDGKRAGQNSCAVGVNAQPECRPRDSRPEESSNPKENAAFDKQLAKEQRRYDKVQLPAFEKKVAELRAQFPEGPWVRTQLSVSEKGSPPTLYFLQVGYEFDSCGDSLPLHEQANVQALQLPRLTEGEQLSLWLRVDNPVNVLLGLTGGESPEDIEKRLQELRMHPSFQSAVNGAPPEAFSVTAPGFWMLMAPVHDDCRSCRDI